MADAASLEDPSTGPLFPADEVCLEVRDLSVERQPLEHLIREIYRRGVDGDAGGAG